ncbi:hypothetical protein TELCIR_14051, partial [Teladorsagia circumcincta]
TMTVGWTYCAEMISPKHRFKLRTFTSWGYYEREDRALNELAYINGLENRSGVLENISANAPIRECKGIKHM